MNFEKTESCAVLALHGFTGAGDDFEYLKTHCADGVRWDTPNLPALPPAELCAFLRSRWERLAGTPRILLGYSMGGRIALHLAGEISWNAGDKLVLVSSSPGLATERERKERRAADEMSAKKIESAASAKLFYEEWRKQPLIATQSRLPSPWRERLLERRARADKSVWATHLRLLGTGTLPSLWGKLAEIPAPEILLIVGEEDMKFRGIAEKMAQEMPQVKMLVVTGSGHSPHLENPAGMASVIGAR